MKTQGSGLVIAVTNEPGVTTRSVTSLAWTSGIRFDNYNGFTGERIFASGVAYLRFSAGLGKIYFNKKVPQDANKWYSFTAGHPYYTAFSVNMTLESMANDLMMNGKLSLSGPLTYDAKKVVKVSQNIVVSGSPPEFLSFYIANTAPYLPVAWVWRSHATGTAKPVEEFTFKNWGLPVRVTAPSPVTQSWKFKFP